MVFVPTWFPFILFSHIICTIVFRRFLGIINVGCLGFHCYVAFLQNTSLGIPLTESMITLFGWVGKYSPKYIFNHSERNIYFKSHTELTVLNCLNYSSFAFVLIIKYLPQKSRQCLCLNNGINVTLISLLIILLFFMNNLFE